MIRSASLESDIQLAVVDRLGQEVIRTASSLEAFVTMGLRSHKMT